MKRLYIISAVLLLAILTVNILFFRSIYFQQIDYQKDIIFNQAEVCGNQIEKDGLDYQNDLNFIAFSEDIADMFENELSMQLSLRKLELFLFFIRTFS
jgi:hypothetical protein